MAEDLFNQESRKKIRSKLIEHAVRCLTVERSNSVCVKRDHVAQVWKQLDESGKADKYFTDEERHEISTEIDLWERFHDSQVQKRKPSDLRVCYLGDDNPINDLEVLVANGVLCQNVWAIKKDSEELEKAWNAIKNSRLRNVRLFKGDIVTFLKDFRGQFDIIYFDACGTLPSVKQNTLKVIGYVFLYDKLTSPGALISNFSFPPQERNYLSSQEVDKERDMINFLVKEYMKYRLCNVLGKADSPTVNALYLSAREDEDNFGDYVSFQVIDSAYLFIPAQRILLSKGESLWGQIFNFSSNVESTTKGTHEKSTKTTRNQKLMESLEMLKEKYNSSFFYQREVESNPCCEAWVAEIFPDWGSEPSEEKHSSHLSSLQHSPPFNVIQFCETVSKCLVPLLKADIDERVLRCCDVTPEQAACLVADLLYGQVAYPSFPVMDKLFRLNYTSKKRQMFSDVFVFDKCRYLYEQFPAVDCVSFAEPKQQMVFRLVVDGLHKHLGGICSEDLFKFGNVASTNEITEGGVSFPNSVRSIPERQKIEDTLLEEKQTQVDSLVRF